MSRGTWPPRSPSTSMSQWGLLLLFVHFSPDLSSFLISQTISGQLVMYHMGNNGKQWLVGIICWLGKHTNPKGRCKGACRTCTFQLTRASVSILVVIWVKFLLSILLPPLSLSLSHSSSPTASLYFISSQQILRYLSQLHTTTSEPAFMSSWHRLSSSALTTIVSSRVSFQHKNTTATMSDDTKRREAFIEWVSRSHHQRLEWQLTKSLGPCRAMIYAWW